MGKEKPKQTQYKCKKCKNQMLTITICEINHGCLPCGVNAGWWSRNKFDEWVDYVPEPGIDILNKTMGWK